LSLRRTAGDARLVVAVLSTNGGMVPRHAALWECARAGTSPGSAGLFTVPSRSRQLHDGLDVEGAQISAFNTGGRRLSSEPTRRWLDATKPRRSQLMTLPDRPLAQAARVPRTLPRIPVLRGYRGSTPPPARSPFPSSYGSPSVPKSSVLGFSTVECRSYMLPWFRVSNDGMHASVLRAVTSPGAAPSSPSRAFWSRVPVLRPMRPAP